MYSVYMGAGVSMQYAEEIHFLGECRLTPHLHHVYGTVTHLSSSMSHCAYTLADRCTSKVVFLLFLYSRVTRGVESEERMAKHLSHSAEQKNKFVGRHAPAR